jgi:hypothetical protein
MQLRITASEKKLQKIFYIPNGAVDGVEGSNITAVVSSCSCGICSTISAGPGNTAHLKNVNCETLLNLQQSLGGTWQHCC